MVFSSCDKNDARDPLANQARNRSREDQPDKIQLSMKSGRLSLLLGLIRMPQCNPEPSHGLFQREATAGAQTRPIRLTSLMKFRLVI